jgi:hypothetical protein
MIGLLSAALEDFAKRSLPNLLENVIVFHDERGAELVMAV